MKTYGSAVEHLLEIWRAEETVGDNIAYWRSDPSRQAEWVDFPNQLHPSITRALQASGIAH